MTILVVVGMFIYLVRQPIEEKLLRFGLALLLGGALSNLLDRIVGGQILDIIETPLRLGIINIADIVINLGMLTILLAAAGSMLRFRYHDLVDLPPSVQKYRSNGGAAAENHGILNFEQDGLC